MLEAGRPPPDRPAGDRCVLSLQSKKDVSEWISNATRLHANIGLTFLTFDALQMSRAR